MTVVRAREKSRELSSQAPPGHVVLHVFCAGGKRQHSLPVAPSCHRQSGYPTCCCTSCLITFLTVAHKRERGHKNFRVSDVADKVCAWDPSNLHPPDFRHTGLGIATSHIPPICPSRTAHYVHICDTCMTAQQTRHVADHTILHTELCVQHVATEQPQGALQHATQLPTWHSRNVHKQCNPLLPTPPAKT
jgi:hypothetical protein